ncbi:acyl carrier protein [Streptomyces sp. FH025]|uniref:acyl carrier protein n=1 Tax=Streptomyces sp. FH025 TaxID=2815937 RepID=UPI001A9F6796|nr:acyl carrier protein [Streptomyces sp. FH025]MBO1414777.1 acyl carrier protein [Streptomyces sp. FH025]
METARMLIREVLDLPVLLDAIGDDQDLVSGGINSGEVVRIALRCEQYLDRALTDEELAGLSSVRAVGELLEGKGR